MIQVISSSGLLAAIFFFIAFGFYQLIILFIKKSKINNINGMEEEFHLSIANPLERKRTILLGLIGGSFAVFLLYSIKAYMLYDLPIFNNLYIAFVTVSIVFFICLRVSLLISASILTKTGENTVILKINANKTLMVIGIVFLLLVIILENRYYQISFLFTFFNGFANYKKLSK